MRAGNFFKSARPENQAQLDELAQYVLAQIRSGLVADWIEKGLSRGAAENLTDFAWLVRGWPVLPDEQKQNIEAWRLN